MRKDIEELESRLKELSKEELEIIQKLKQLRGECTHLRENGESAYNLISWDGHKNVYECEVCGRIKKGIY